MIPATPHIGGLADTGDVTQHSGFGEAGGTAPSPRAAGNSLEVSAKSRTQKTNLPILAARPNPSRFN